MSYAIPYLLMLGCYACMAVCYDRTATTERRTLIVLLCIGLALFFFGLRGYIMYDWYSYCYHFMQFDVQQFTLFGTHEYEIGYETLVYLCKSYYPNYHFFVFVITTIEVLLLTRFFVRHTPNVPMAFMICFSVSYLGVMTNLLRNGLSLCICLNAIDYIYQRKSLKYFALCLLALSFHNSTILMFPLYFFLHKRINTKILAIVFGIGVITFVLRLPILTGIVEKILGQVDQQLNFYLSVYLNTENPYNVNYVFLARFMTGVLTLCFISRLRAMRPDADIYINALFIFLFIYMFGYEIPTGSSRIATLFYYGLWFAWFGLYECITLPNNRKLTVIIICMYCSLRIFGQTLNKPLAEYENILFDSHSFQDRASLFKQTQEP